MKIEAGKFYRSRDGRKFGPMEKYPKSMNNMHPWRVVSLGMLWQYDGKAYQCQYPEQDLLEEWHDEPETGTLAELNVKQGDVVECVNTDCIFNWTKGYEYNV